MSKQFRWNDEWNEWLEFHFTFMTAKEIGKLLGISDRAVHCHCSTLGITKPKRFIYKNHPLWSKYNTMITRCYNKNRTNYKNYGGRGIYVDDWWLGEGGFENFLRDMRMPPSPNHSLDRIDNDGPYSPDNCRWATEEQQRNNKRQRNTVWYNGRWWEQKELAEKHNIDRTTFYGRMKKGWSIEKALNTPVNMNKSRKKYDRQN